MKTNNVPTDAEITALAKKHIATKFDRLNAIRPVQTPFEDTEMFRRLKTYTLELLTRFGQSVGPVKCDGNHGGPRCTDPECWNDSPSISADAEDAARYRTLRQAAISDDYSFIEASQSYAVENTKDLHNPTAAEFDAAVDHARRRKEGDPNA